jgi:IS605 OrfB family transposase
MRRSSRVYLNDLNPGKAERLRSFLRVCRDATAYFVDLFWQRADFSPKLAELETVHRGRNRFHLTTRLAQALAKQAKEIIRSQIAKRRRKPRLRKPTVTLYYHFVSVERFEGAFDWALKLTGSGAPRMVIPVRSTAHLNRLMASGWHRSRTLRLGQDREGRLFVDFILEKPRPALKTEGQVVGMDSNYKQGFVFSDGQVAAAFIYQVIQRFQKRQKHTHAEIRSRLGAELKQIDFTKIKTPCLEDLKKVKHYKHGKFPRVLNRRLSHWLYASTVEWLARRCEELGIRLEKKDPWKTSQYCRRCGKWDRRSRVGDRFRCVHCGFTEHADLNAAQNLELLGVAGVYGLRFAAKPGALLNSAKFWVTIQLLSSGVFFTLAECSVSTVIIIISSSMCGAWCGPTR